MDDEFTGTVQGDQYWRDGEFHGTVQGQEQVGGVFEDWNS
jgi:hypothetical protein